MAVAPSWGGCRASNNWRRCRGGEIEPRDNTEVSLPNSCMPEMPDPDLMIRTSGEMRISNFLLWQISYAKIFVTPTLWPDFSREEFLGILKEYQQRDRRFGKIGT